MSAAGEPLTATAYLQVWKRQPWGPYTAEARVVKTTQKKPDVVEPGCIVVKVRIRIPREAWEAFEPEAVIDVPAELIQHPIEVEAADANA